MDNTINTKESSVRMCCQNPRCPRKNKSIYLGDVKKKNPWRFQMSCKYPEIYEDLTQMFGHKISNDLAKGNLIEEAEVARNRRSRIGAENIPLGNCDNYLADGLNMHLSHAATTVEHALNIQIYELHYFAPYFRVYTMFCTLPSFLKRGLLEFQHCCQKAVVCPKHQCRFDCCKDAKDIMETPLYAYPYHELVLKYEQAVWYEKQKFREEQKKKRRPKHEAAKDKSTRGYRRKRYRPITTSVKFNFDYDSMAKMDVKFKNKEIPKCKDMFSTVENNYKIMAQNGFSDEYKKVFFRNILELAREAAW